MMGMQGMISNTQIDFGLNRKFYIFLVSLTLQRCRIQLILDFALETLAKCRAHQAMCQRGHARLLHHFKVLARIL